MTVEQAYNNWSQQYDTSINRTRDGEAIALQTVLGTTTASAILEIGCGTGKNTSHLLTMAETVLAVDLSEAMLAKAKQKIIDPKVHFTQANINAEWDFTDQQFDLITFSLVLEHIENLDFVFNQARQKLKAGGRIYVGELHPFKQYAGSKARFDTPAGRIEVACYTHHISDFVQAAKNNGLQLCDLQEFFDDNNQQTMPRILTLIFTKQ